MGLCLLFNHNLVLLSLTKMEVADDFRSQPCPCLCPCLVVVGAGCCPCAGPHSAPRTFDGMREAAVNGAALRTFAKSRAPMFNMRRYLHRWSVSTHHLEQSPPVTSATLLSMALLDGSGLITPRPTVSGGRWCSDYSTTHLSRPWPSGGRTSVQNHRHPNHLIF